MDNRIQNICGNVIAEFDEESKNKIEMALEITPLNMVINELDRI